MIIYIHGFGGSGAGVKARAAKKMFGEADLLAPSLSYVPDLAVATLSELIELLQRQGEPVSLIGSSLGGYYAIYLAEKYNLKAVLINPSVHPYQTLEKSIGRALNFFDLSRFEWNERHIQTLRHYEVDAPDPSRYLLLLQKGDELLDYREALAKLPGAEGIVEEGGSHSYEGFEGKRVFIASFFGMDHT